MATKTWTGTNGSFRDPNAWTPAGVPVSGDTAEIHGGTVHASLIDLSGIPLDVGTTQAHTTPDLALTGVRLGNVDVHQDPRISGPHAPTIANISVSGFAIEAGTMNVGIQDVTGGGIAGDVAIDLVPVSAFVVQGSITEFAGSSLTVTGGPLSFLVNDGGFSDVGGTAKIDVPIVGNGSIGLNRGKFSASDVDLEKGVSAGQSIALRTQNTLELGTPAAFRAQITMEPFANLDLHKTVADSFTWINDVLTVMDKGVPLDRFHLTAPQGTGLIMSQNGPDTVFRSTFGGGGVMDTHTTAV